VAAAGSLVSPASAQETRPENRNAAIRYATIFYTVDSDVLAKAAELDMSAVGYDKAKTPEAFKQAAEVIRTKGEGTVGELLEASRMNKCDFELAYEKGFMVMLPHLSKMRSSVRMLRVDSRRVLLEGDDVGAAERLAAMIRMAGHARNDRTLISSLVSAAICSVTLDETEAALQAEKLTPEARAIIASALDKIGTDDPFAMKAAIRGEQRLTALWIKQTFHGEAAGKKLVETGLISTTEGNLKASQAIAVMNEAQLTTAVDVLNPYYDQVLAAWDKPDAVQQLESLAQRVTNGEFGPMGQVLAPAVSKARAASLKGEKRIQEVKQKLAGK
jgi:cytochrome c551/c552